MPDGLEYFLNQLVASPLRLTSSEPELAVVGCLLSQEVLNTWQHCLAISVLDDPSKHVGRSEFQIVGLTGRRGNQLHESAVVRRVVVPNALTAADRTATASSP